MRSISSTPWTTDSGVGSFLRRAPHDRCEDAPLCPLPNLSISGSSHLQQSASPVTATGPAVEDAAQEMLTRVALREHAVLVYGPAESPSLLYDTNKLLKFLQRECGGSFVGAFRFHTTAPPGYCRPAFRTPVFLVVLERPESVDAALRVCGRWLDAYMLHVRRPRPVTPEVAERHLRLFQQRDEDVVAGCQPTALTAPPSQLLWSVIFSESSAYYVDWAAARAAALRFDAVVVDESRVTPIKPHPLLWSSSSDGRRAALRGERSAPGSNRSQGGGGPTAATGQRADAGRAGPTTTDSASAGHNALPFSFSIPTSVQQQYYQQKYGVAHGSSSDGGGGGFYHTVTTGLVDAVSRGWQSVVGQFGSYSEEPLPLGGGSLGAMSSVPQEGSSTAEVPRRRVYRGGDYPTERPSTRRRLESDPRSFPRLSAVGGALTWVPGFEFIFPLFRSHETAVADQRGVPRSRRATAPGCEGREEGALDKSRQASSASFLNAVPSTPSPQPPWPHMSLSPTTGHVSLPDAKVSARSGGAINNGLFVSPLADPRDAHRRLLTEESLLKQFPTPQEGSEAPSSLSMLSIVAEDYRSEGGAPSLSESLLDRLLGPLRGVKRRRAQSNRSEPLDRSRITSPRF